MLQFGSVINTFRDRCVELTAFALIFEFWKGKDDFTLGSGVGAKVEVVKRSYKENATASCVLVL